MFVYPQNGSPWSETQILIPSGSIANNKFGFSLSVYGKLLAVGTPLDDAGTELNTGIFILHVNLVVMAAVKSLWCPVRVCNCLH